MCIQKGEDEGEKKKAWTWRGNIIQCPFIYLSFTTLSLNIFFKKFKYLLGTQVKKQTEKLFFAKTKTKHLFKTSVSYLE